MLIEKAREELLRYLKEFRGWWSSKMGDLHQFPFLVPSVLASHRGVEFLRNISECLYSLASLKEDETFRRQLDAHAARFLHLLLPFAGGTDATRFVYNLTNLRDFVEDWLSFYCNFRGWDIINQLGLKERAYIPSLLIEYVRQLDAKYDPLQQVSFTGKDDRIFYTSFSSLLSGFYEDLLDRAEREGLIDANRKRELLAYSGEFIDGFIKWAYPRGVDAASLGGKFRRLSGVKFFAHLDYVMSIVPPPRVGEFKCDLTFPSGYGVLYSPVELGKLLLGAQVSEKDVEAFLSASEALQRRSKELEVVLARLNNIVGQFGGASEEDMYDAAREYLRVLRAWFDEVEAYQKCLSLIEKLGLPLPVNFREAFTTLRDLINSKDAIDRVFSTYGEEGLVRVFVKQLIFRRMRPFGEGRVTLDDILAILDRLRRLFIRLSGALVKLVPHFPSGAGRAPGGDWADYFEMLYFRTVGRTQGFIQEELERVFERELLEQELEKFIETGQAGRGLQPYFSLALRRRQQPLFSASGLDVWGSIFYWGQTPYDTLVVLSRRDKEVLEYLHRGLLKAWVDECEELLVRHFSGYLQEVFGDKWRDEVKKIARSAPELLFKDVEPPQPLWEDEDCAVYRLKELAKPVKIGSVPVEGVLNKVFALYTQRHLGEAVYLDRLGEGSRLQLLSLESKAYKDLVNLFRDILVEMERLLMLTHHGGGVLEALSYDPDPVKAFSNYASLIDAWIKKEFRQMLKSMVQLLVAGMMRKLRQPLGKLFLSLLLKRLTLS